jgi:hypothetical protein
MERMKTGICILLGISFSFAFDGSKIQPLENVRDTAAVTGASNETAAVTNSREIVGEDFVKPPEPSAGKLVTLGKFHVAEGVTETVYSSLGILAGILTIANARGESGLVASGIISIAGSAVTLTLGIIEIRVGVVLKR